MSPQVNGLSLSSVLAYEASLRASTRESDGLACGRFMRIHPMTVAASLVLRTELWRHSHGWNPPQSVINAHIKER